MPDNNLEKTGLIRSTLPPGSYKTSLDTSPPPILLARMHVSNYKATFSPMHLAVLELDIAQPHLDFKLLEKNNNDVIPRTLYLQLLNKQ